MKNLKSILSELEIFMDLPDELDPVLDRFFLVKNALALCDEDSKQIPDLILALGREAQKRNLEFCVLHLDSLPDFIHQLKSVKYDTQTDLSLIPGPLERCLNAGGLLVLVSITPTIESLNSVFDRTAFSHPEFTSPDCKPIIEISKELSIIVINKMSSEFKLLKLPKSLLGRLENIFELPPTLNFPKAYTLKTSSEIDEKLSYIEIDFQYSTEIQQFLFNYPLVASLDAKEKSSRQPGSLIKALEKYEQISFKNLNLADNKVVRFIDNLVLKKQLEQPLEIDGELFDLRRVNFFKSPDSTLEELKKITANKILQIIDSEQLSQLVATQKVWWINPTSYSELYQLYGSMKIPGPDQFQWCQYSGFIDYFLTKDQMRNLIIVETLPKEALYQLLHDSRIPNIFVLNNVSLPDPLRKLFTSQFFLPPNSQKAHLESKSSPISLYLADTLMHPQIIADFKTMYSECAVFYTSSAETQQGFIEIYGKNREFHLGAVARELKESKLSIISGGALLDLYPNLINDFSLLSVNGKIINPYQEGGKICFLLNATELQRHPWILSMAHLIMPELEDSSITPTKSALSGREGLESALSKQSEKPRLIFISGPPASGKSFAIDQLIKQEKAHVFTISIRPSILFDDIKPILMEFAKANEMGDNRLRILKLEEINLLRDEGIIIWLLGLITNPKKVNFPDGSAAHLQPYHIVLGLRNHADETRGRKKFNVLDSYADHIEFFPFSEQEIENIIFPIIKADCGYEEKEARATARYILIIREQIKVLQPDFQFDLRYILSLIAHIASQNYHFTDWEVLDEKHVPYQPSSFPLLLAIQELVFPALEPQPLRALRHWLCLKFAVEESVSLPSLWARRLIDTDPALWDTENSRQLVTAVLSFFQVRECYLAKGKLPPKIALLLRGETNTGKSYVTRHLLEKRGYRLGENYLEWTAGTHGDLNSLVETCRKNGWMLLIHEINAFPTYIIEGALNTVLSGDAKLGFGLILTANQSYQYREIFSNAFESRLIIYDVNEFVAQDLLKLHAVDEEAAEFISTVHQAAGQFSSTRLLLNAIRHCKKGLNFHRVCAMTYGLLLKEIAEENLAEDSHDQLNSTNSYISFLSLLKENHLIVLNHVALKQHSPWALGELDRQNGHIIFPLIYGFNAESGYFQILILRTYQFQLLNEIKLDEFVSLEKKYLVEIFFELKALFKLKNDYPGCNRIFQICQSYYYFYQGLFNHLTSPGPWNHEQLQKLEFELITELENRSARYQMVNDFVFIASIYIRWYGIASIFTLPRPNWTKIREQIVWSIPIKFIFLSFLAKIAEWLEEKSIQQVIEKFIIKNEPQNEEFITPLVDDVIKKAPVLIPKSKPSRRSSLSGVTTLPRSEKVIANISSFGKYFFPLSLFKTDEQKNIILSEGGFQDVEVPRTFFPTDAPIDSHGIEIKIELVNPVTNQDNKKIPLLVPFSFYPNSLPSGVNMSWEGGNFYVETTEAVSSLKYTIISDKTKPDFKVDKLSPPKIFPTLNDIGLTYELKECLHRALRSEKKSTLRNCLQEFCEIMKKRFTYLNQTEDFFTRQMYHDLYAKNDSISIVQYCLKTLTGVCAEFALTVYTFWQPLLSAYDIPIYLSRVLVAENGRATDVAHLVVIVCWYGYPEIFDPTPPRRPLQSPNPGGSYLNETGFFKQKAHQLIGDWSSCDNILVNPLLEFFAKEIHTDFLSTLDSLKSFSLEYKGTIYNPTPPGVLDIKRYRVGLFPFKKMVTEENLRLQTLIIASFPSIDKGEEFIQFGCIYFLLNLLIEKGFELMVWTYSGPVLMKKTTSFKNMLGLLKPPTTEDLSKFNYSEPYKIMVERDWRRLLDQFAIILETQVNEEKYYQSVGNPSKPEAKQTNLKIEDFSAETLTEFMGVLVDSMETEEYEVIITIKNTTIETSVGERVKQLEGRLRLVFDNVIFNVANLKLPPYHEHQNVKISIANSIISKSLYESLRTSCVVFYNCQFDFLKETNIYKETLVPDKKNRNRIQFNWKGERATQDFLDSLRYYYTISLKAVDDVPSSNKILNFKNMSCLRSLKFINKSPFNLKSLLTLSHPLVELVFPDNTNSLSEIIDQLVNEKIALSIGICLNQLPSRLTIRPSSSLMNLHLFGYEYDLDDEMDNDVYANSTITLEKKVLLINERVGEDSIKIANFVVYASIFPEKASLREVIEIINPKGIYFKNIAIMVNVKKDSRIIKTLQDAVATASIGEDKQERRHIKLYYPMEAIQSFVTSCRSRNRLFIDETFSAEESEDDGILSP